MPQAHDRWREKAFMVEFSDFVLIMVNSLEFVFNFVVLGDVMQEIKVKRLEKLPTWLWGR